MPPMTPITHIRFELISCKVKAILVMKFMIVVDKVVKLHFIGVMEDNFLDERKVFFNRLSTGK